MFFENENISDPVPLNSGQCQINVHAERKFRITGLFNCSTN